MWEHMVIKIAYREPHTKAIQQELDNASADGWELVSTSWDSDSYDLYLFFKREVEYPTPKNPPSV